MAQAVAKTVDPTTQAETAKPKRERIQYKESFPNAEEAIKEAHSRVKGPRRAFKCVDKHGKVVFAVAHNEGRAGGVAYMLAGGQVEELGKIARAARPVTADAALAVVNGLPEAEKAKVLAELKALLSGK